MKAKNIHESKKNLLIEEEEAKLKNLSLGELAVELIDLLTNKNSKDPMLGIRGSYDLLPCVSLFQKIPAQISEETEDVSSILVFNNAYYHFLDLGVIHNTYGAFYLKIENNTISFLHTVSDPNTNSLSYEERVIDVKYAAYMRSQLIKQINREILKLEKNSSDDGDTRMITIWDQADISVFDNPIK